MDEFLKEREHAINLLKKAKLFAKKDQSGKIKDLSNQTVHSASIYQDEVSIFVSIVVYSLSKIMDRGGSYYKEDYQGYLEYYLSLIEKLINHLENKEDKKFIEEVKGIINSKNIPAGFKTHLSSLFSKAKVNKASKVYEHGISMEKTAKLMGISLWELAEYSGGSYASEMKQGETLDVQQRVKKLMEIFQ